MSQNSPHILSEDARQGLTDRTALSARRNQPRYLVVFAGGLLAVAVVVALFGLSSRYSALSTLDAELARTKKVEGLVAEITSIREREQKSFADRSLDKNSKIYTEIERFAREVSLKDVRVDESPDPQGGAAGTKFQKRRYTANLTRQETDLILRWISRVTTELPGVQLATLDLKPDIATVEGKPRWQGSVGFSRWERK